MGQTRAVGTGTAGVGPDAGDEQDLQAQGSGASSRGPDFIGIGAQRSGTSWIYACLFEHPELCLPRKEINFFSRERNWSRGFDWYEAIFAECRPGLVAGEYSTSYLAHNEAPVRICERYPSARLMVSLRNPVDRAFSSYLNDIVAGVVPAATGFSKAMEFHPEYLERGRYAYYLRGYFAVFPREQIWISVFEEARRDPETAIGDMYRFLGVDPSFRPAMLDRAVGEGRVPRFQWLERSLIDVAAAFQRNRVLRPVWWRLKRLGLGDRVRALNTAGDGDKEPGLSPQERSFLAEHYEPEIAALEDLLGLDLSEWRS